jgi:hypothetical protein
MVHDKTGATEFETLERYFGVPGTGARHRLKNVATHTAATHPNK